jgi:hypothetical protein
MYVPFYKHRGLTCTVMRRATEAKNDLDHLSVVVSSSGRHSLLTTDEIHYGKLRVLV